MIQLHRLFVHAVPVMFAFFGVWLLRHKGKKALWRWGLSISLALLVLAAIVPSITVYYYHGPLCSEGTSGLALPLSTLLVLGIQAGMHGRLPLPQWALILICALIGQLPILGMGYIS